MARPARITNEQILSAAREVFLEQGFGAPTSEVARRAGVSEGTLFKRYATKNTLFAAAMGLPQPPDWTREWRALAGQGEVVDNLAAILLDLVAFFRESMPRMLMTWSSRSAPPLGFLADHDDAPPLRTAAALAAYLHAEQEQSRVRPCDTHVAARILMGAAINFVFWELVGLNPEELTDADVYARRAAERLVRGLAPEAV